MSPGLVAQQPCTFKQMVPLLNIFRLLTCEVGTIRPTSEALVSYLMSSSWYNKYLFPFSLLLRYIEKI